MTIKAKCPMHLRKFPLDSQSCPLEMGSCKYSFINLNLNSKLLIFVIEKLSEFNERLWSHFQIKE